MSMTCERCSPSSRIRAIMSQSPVGWAGAGWTVVEGAGTDWAEDGGAPGDWAVTERAEGRGKASPVAAAKMKNTISGIGDLRIRVIGNSPFGDAGPARAPSLAGG